MDSAVRLLNSYPLIYPLDSVIHSFKKRAQIYNKGHSVTEFLFSHENKVKEITIILESTLFLTRYKNCPNKKGMGKEKSNSRKFKRPKDLDMISKLSSKHQKPKTKNYKKDNEYESDLRCNEVNMKYIYIHIYDCHIFTAINYKL